MSKVKMACKKGKKIRRSFKSDEATPLDLSLDGLLLILS